MRSAAIARRPGYTLSMRIIAGIHRGRKILAPADASATRPITDRVKQAMFDRLTAMGLTGGGNVLDIFAGTGSLGLEALSREADHCTFVERDRDAVAQLERNLADLRLAGQATVLNADATATNWSRRVRHRPVSVIFCDPPYRMMHDERDRQQVLTLIESLAEVADDDCVCVLRSDDRTTPPTAAGWRGPDSHPYGSMTLHFYEVER